MVEQGLTSHHSLQLIHWTVYTIDSKVMSYKYAKLFQTPEECIGWCLSAFQRLRVKRSNMVGGKTC